MFSPVSLVRDILFLLKESAVTRATSGAHSKSPTENETETEI